MSAEDIHLCLYAFFQPVFQRGGCLSLQRKRDAPGSEDIIGRVKEGTDTSDSQIIHRLIDDFLQHDGSQAGIQRAGRLQTKFINSLAADQRGYNRHVTGDIVQLLSLFIYDLVKSEIFKAFRKFRICMAIISHCDSLRDVYFPQNDRAA